MPLLGKYVWNVSSPQTQNVMRIFRSATLAGKLVPGAEGGRGGLEQRIGRHTKVAAKFMAVAEPPSLKGGRWVLQHAATAAVATCELQVPVGREKRIDVEIERKRELVRNLQASVFDYNIPATPLRSLHSTHILTGR